MNALDESFHEQVSPNKGNFVCDSCGNQYKTKSGLQKHLNMKHNTLTPKPLECKTCKLKFTTKGHLEGHVNTHYNLKPYACTICNKRYNYRSALLRHSTTDHDSHDKEKPAKPKHTCMICGRVYNRKDLLSDHMRGKHTNEFKYTCNLCGSSFRWRGSRNRHRHCKHGTKTKK